MQSVQWSDDSFTLQPTTFILTWAELMEAFDGNMIPLACSFSPDDSTEALRTHNLVWLPPRFTALAFQNLSVRHFKEQVGDAVVAKGLDLVLAPLLGWIRIVCTKDDAPGHTPKNRLRSPALVFPPDPRHTAC